MKTSITSIASTVIIARHSDPTQIFVEKKDDGHPIGHARNKLCTIGGNWIGDNAKDDYNTRTTLHREIGEELSLARSTRNSSELVQLAVADNMDFAPTPINEAVITENDIERLEYLKLVITGSTKPFGDFINTIPRAALDAADPQNKREGFKILVSYFTVGLVENDWEMLCTLQKKFGNLSNESITMVTSLEEIVRTKTQMAFGHDLVLRTFWRTLGLRKAESLSLVPGIESEDMGRPLPSYEMYLQKYDVAKKPV